MNIFGIYLAGILSFFSPCILPIIPVYFSILTDNKGKLLLRGVIFCIGFTAVFTLLGLGAGGIASNLFANRPAITVIAGVIILLLALKFLGLINIPLLDRTYSIDLKNFRTKFGLLNAFIIGVLFAATWSPCIGAVLGSILTYVSSTSDSAWNGGIKLFIFSAGISTPLIISTFFYNKLLLFFKNNKYFLFALQKILGIVLIIFSFSLFSQGIKPAYYGTKDLKQKDKAILPTSHPLMVSFVSDDCDDCREMAPIVDRLRDACGDRIIEFRTINIDESQYAFLTYQLAIYGTPTYIFIDKKGEEKDRLMGIQDIKILDKDIEGLTGSSCLNYNVHP